MVNSCFLLLLLINIEEYSDILGKLPLIIDTQIIHTFFIYIYIYVYNYIKLYTMHSKTEMKYVFMNSNKN